jgi:deoxyribonuclease V
MLKADLTSWPRNYREAVAVQEEMRHKVELCPLPGPVRLVAGVDAAYDRKDRRLFGAAAVYTYPELELVEEAEAAGPVPFPYIPGLLTFREAPILVEVYGKLRHRPDVLLVDGQGIAHPRGLGIASHLGLLLDIPTIGVAKSRLVGEGPEPGWCAGLASFLIWQGKLVGLILRTREGKKPLYLSPGHRVTLAEAREIVLGCVKRYRIPLPLRQADLLSQRSKVAERRS